MCECVSGIRISSGAGDAVAAVVVDDPRERVRVSIPHPTDRQTHILVHSKREKEKSESESQVERVMLV